ncbi:condensation domain-containing protein [Micromonospora yangpuensis]|uniref:Phosphopantetheine attachment site n=1 Tax=Micromonospora yangpuensis TaxID=683228 RepID=A0A1C6VGX3_9ACTN|nr:condensation domain-containing protein [Micromonospora yangpuensis]GGL99295.1 hypothetical protein GCM10012279_15820 [Micromonospora yangpuensis]SCL65551.1 Phosphopantetheine attachment site [Micromonospora yangpuensis]
MSDDAYLLPASFGQERLWLVEQLQPGSPLYHVPATARLRGPLDVAVLQRCLTEIVERHEALRTVLRMEQGAVCQLIRDSVPVPLEVVEPVDDASAAVAAAVREPFDVGVGPLIRCRLLRLAPQEHLLVIVVHHAVADGWSLGVLVRELGVLYAAHREGTPVEMPELAVQYADFAVWQRETAGSESLTRQLDFWRGQLAGAAPLRLPPDLPYPAEPQATAHTAVSRVPAEVLHRLRSGVDASVTDFMLMLTAYAVVLARWSGQPEVVVAVPVAGRDQAEVEPVIGFFVNTLPLRVPVGGTSTFRELLGEVRDRWLAALANAEPPYERIVEVAGVRRRAGRLPLARAMFGLNNTPFPRLGRMGDLTVEQVPVPVTHIEFDVLTELATENDTLVASFAVSADLFEQRTAELLARSFLDVLSAAADDPDLDTAALPCAITSAVGARGDGPGYPEEPASTGAPAGAPSAGTGGAPQSPAEQLIARLWREVLDVAVVDVDDEFYARGGNSLRAVRVVMAARESGLSLPVEALMGEHTVRQLAAAAHWETPVKP